MKKIFFILLLSFSFYFSNAQEVRFGASVGFLNGTAVYKTDDLGLQEKSTISRSGFYMGYIAEFYIDGYFSFQPELLYQNVDNLSYMHLPLNMKYYPAKELYILVGPYITYNLEEIFEDETPFNFGFGVGLGFDIDEYFFIQARYTYQLNNYITSKDESTDIASERINILSVGLGYKFN